MSLIKVGWKCILDTHKIQEWAVSSVSFDTVSKILPMQPAMALWTWGWGGIYYEQEGNGSIYLQRQLKWKAGTIQRRRRITTHLPDLKCVLLWELFGEAAGAVLVVPRDLLAQDGLVEHCAEAVGLIDGGHVHQRDGDGGQEELAHSQYGRNNGCKIYRVTMVVSNWDLLTTVFLVPLSACSSAWAVANWANWAEQWRWLSNYP